MFHNSGNFFLHGNIRVVELTVRNAPSRTEYSAASRSSEQGTDDTEESTVVERA